MEDGAGRAGCEMGPSAFRVAGIAAALEELGYQVADRGNLSAAPRRSMTHPNAAVRSLPQIVAWTEAIAEATYRAAGDGFPIVFGGDHSLAAGSICGLSRHAAESDRELFVLWLDAHTDFHTLESTISGNLHGVPVAYITGQSGFEGYFPPIHPVKPANVLMMGIRSVDPAERAAAVAAGVTVLDMRAIDEHGVVRPLKTFLQRVAEANGLLHVSLDVDFLDPGIAPGVGTTVPGGATFREAHLIMEMVHDSGLASSLDLAELNPFLDDRGRTATLMVDLAASLMGRRVMDRATKVY